MDPVSETAGGDQGVYMVALNALATLASPQNILSFENTPLALKSQERFLSPQNPKP